MNCHQNHSENGRCDHTINFLARLTELEKTVLLVKWPSSLDASITKKKKWKSRSRSLASIPNQKLTQQKLLASHSLRLCWPIDNVLEQKATTILQDQKSCCTWSNQSESLDGNCCGSPDSQYAWHIRWTRCRRGYLNWQLRMRESHEELVAVENIQLTQLTPSWPIWDQIQTCNNHCGQKLFHTWFWDRIQAGFSRSAAARLDHDSRGDGGFVFFDMVSPDHYHQDLEKGQHKLRHGPARERRRYSTRIQD